METRNFIGGEWSTTKNTTVDVFNTSDLSEKIGVINEGTEEDVLNAEKAAKEAQKEWAKKPGPQKAEILYNMAKALENNLQEVAELGSKEMGKQIRSEERRVGKEG